MSIVSQQGQVSLRKRQLAYHIHPPCGTGQHLFHMERQVLIVEMGHSKQASSQMSVTLWQPGKPFVAQPLIAILCSFAVICKGGARVFERFGRNLQ